MEVQDPGDKQYPLKTATTSLFPYSTSYSQVFNHCFTDSHDVPENTRVCYSLHYLRRNSDIGDHHPQGRKNGAPLQLLFLPPAPIYCCQTKRIKRHWQGMTAFSSRPPCSQCSATSGREGTDSLRRSTALPPAQPELPNLELFFFPQNFWRTPHTSSCRHGQGAWCAACARVR